MSPVELKQHWENVIAEIKKNPTILGNKMWRLENLYVISTKRGKKGIFKLNRAQRHFLENMKHRNVILKSRQLGFTTLITLWILDETLFSTNKDGLAIAHTKDGIVDIFDKKAKFAVINFPPEIQSIINFRQNSKTRLQIIFKDGSTSTFGVALSGRSGTYQYIHISEFAKLSKQFPQRAEEVITGTLPAVPMDGYVFIESTAEGATGNFHDIFMRAWEVKGKGNDTLFMVQFYPHFYNWTWDDMELEIIGESIPIKDMERGNIDWEDYQKVHGLTDKEMTYYYMKWVSLNKDLDRLNAEYPTTIDEAFVSTGKPYFDIRKIVSLVAQAKEPEYYTIIGTEISDAYAGELMVYEKPKANTAYLIGADTAEGLGNGDYSTMCVIDVQTRNICAIYRNHIVPDEFEGALRTVGNWFNNALLAIEVNKDGLWVNNEVVRNGYENVYFRQKMDDITKNVNKLFGWKTDRATRDSMLTELRSVFSEQSFYCLPLLKEMESFVRNSRGKPEAMSGAHDDLIVAAAIAFQVRKLLYNEDFRMPALQLKPTSHMDIIFGLTRG